MTEERLLPCHPPHTHGINLECWNCHEKKGTDFPEPHFGVDLARAALENDWKPYLDGSGVLVFCSESCAKKSLTKTGYFKRRRPARAIPGAGE